MYGKQMLSVCQDGYQVFHSPFYAVVVSSGYQASDANDSLHFLFISKGS